jgi:hypothetical protein
MKNVFNSPINSFIMKTFFLVLFFAAIITIKAQPPIKFYTKFGGSGDDIGYSGKQTLDRHYIVAGSTSSYGNGNTDVYLVKVDSMGMLLWEKYIGGFGNDVGKSVIQLADSGYVITGFTNSYGAGGYDAFTIRTDKSGNLIWQKTFGGLDWDFASDLVQGADGNIFVVGNTVSFGAGKKDGFVLKYDLLGNLIWQKFYGGNENEELRSIIKTNDNFLATVGYTESRGDINGDGYFLKLNLNGDTLFTFTYGGPYKDYTNDLIQKSNGEYYFCGAKTFSINTKTLSQIYRTNSNGVLIRDTSYKRGTEDEDFISVTNSFQQSYLTGFVRTVPMPTLNRQSEIFVCSGSLFSYKVNDQGGYDDEFVYSVEGTKDGGFLIVGSTASFGSFGKDVFFVKQDSTCYNYTSIVGVKENIVSRSPTIYYENNHELSVFFDEFNIPETIAVIDMSGNLVIKYSVKEKEIKLNLSELTNAIYLLRYSYKNGTYFYNKICPR